MHEPLLPPETLARYADAIVRASLGVEKGDTLVVQGEPEHRELLVAVAESAYRAGAQFVDAITVDSLVMRARLLYGTADALGGVSPWALRRYRELADPRGALAVIAGEGDEGYFDGVSPERIAIDFAGRAKKLAFFQRAQLDMRARWTIAGWPTNLWAKQVYPELETLEAKRRLARDLLHFCRLGDEDGKGTSGWLKHVRTLGRRSARLTKLGLTRLELRGPGTELDLGFVAATRWLGGGEEMPHVRQAHRGEHADGGGLHEPGSTPDDRELPLHVSPLLPRPPDSRAPRRVLEGAARSARGRLRRRSRLRRRLPRHRPGGASSRRDRARRRVVPDRPDGPHLLQHAARRERGERTSRSAAVSEARVRKHLPVR